MDGSAGTARAAVRLVQARLRSPRPRDDANGPTTVNLDQRPQLSPASDLWPVAGSAGDLWWDLNDEGSLQRADYTLRELGLPWLDQFPDRQAVLDAVAARGPLDLGMSPAAHLDIAEVYRAIGNPESERRTLEGYVSRAVLASHAPYLTDYLHRHGHADLAQQVTTTAT